MKYYRIRFSAWTISVLVKCGDLVTVYKNGRKGWTFNEKNVQACHRKMWEHLYV